MLRKLDDFGKKIMVTLPENQACGDFGKFPSMDNESFIPLSIVKEMYSIKKEVDSWLSKLEMIFLFKARTELEENRVKPKLSNERPIGVRVKEIGSGEVERFMGYNEKEMNGLEDNSSDGQVEFNKKQTFEDCIEDQNLVIGEGRGGVGKKNGGCLSSEDETTRASDLKSEG